MSAIYRTSAACAAVTVILRVLCQLSIYCRPIDDGRPPSMSVNAMGTNGPLIIRPRHGDPQRGARP